MSAGHSYAEVANRLMVSERTVRRDVQDLPPWTIDQPLLLPASVQDFVGEDHLARFVLVLVLEHLDLGEIEAATRASGASRRLTRR